MSQTYCNLQHRLCTFVPICWELQNLTLEKRHTIITLWAILDLSQGKRRVVKIDDISNLKNNSNKALSGIIKVCSIILGEFQYSIYDGHLFISKEKKFLEIIQQKKNEWNLFHYPSCCIKNYADKVEKNRGDNPFIDATFPEEGVRTCPLVKSVYHTGWLSMHHVCERFCRESLEKNEAIVALVLKKFPHLL
jgi:hypothetical protein